MYTVVPSFARIILCCVCVPRFWRFLVVFLLPQTAGMCSKDTAFQHALSSVPGRQLTAIKESASDQPCAGGLHCWFGYSYRYRIYGLYLFSLFVFSFACCVVRVSPSGTLSKPVEKRIRSRKGEKLRGGKRKNGRLEWWRKGRNSRRKSSALLKQFLGRLATVVEWLGKNQHFLGFSQHFESCGVSARLKTSELSAHQVPEILHAERSSNASSASQLGGSTLDPWEQASRESYISLVSGGLLPEGFEDSFVWLAQKARPAQKRIQKRIATMSPMDLGQEHRERQASTRQARQPRNSSFTPAVGSPRRQGRDSR